MIKQILDMSLIDKELHEDVLEALKRSKARGTHAIVSFGTLCGAAVACADEAQATLTDIWATVSLCWKLLKDQEANEKTPIS